MRSREDFSPYIRTGLGLTLAILAIFQVYLFREPNRIQAAKAEDLAAAVDAGRSLFQANCTACHGQNGEGIDAPALNSKELLTTTQDETFFSLIRTGVPASEMPAWGQTFGGPFTDEQVASIVAYLRSWEPTAMDVTPEASVPSAARGAAIFANTCSICHGENGTGSDLAPALNDSKRLHLFDDAWYRDTIAQGRPAKGMPTWGTVLSPTQIDDLVALLSAWRGGNTVTSPIPMDDHLAGALFALERSDALDAVYHLNAALELGNGSQVEVIQAVLESIKRNDLSSAIQDLSDLAGVSAASLEQGQQVFAANCAPCHAPDGRGGIGPDLHENAFLQSQIDADLAEFLLAGRSGTAMAGFQGRLSQKQLSAVIDLMRSWQQ